MPFRDDKREIFANDNKLYSNYLKGKNLKLIRHYSPKSLFYKEIFFTFSA